MKNNNTMNTFINACLAAILFLSLPAIFADEESKWGGDILFGLSETSGSSNKSKLNIAADVKTPWMLGDINWKGYYSYGQSNDVKNEDRHGLSVRSRLNLSANTFAQSWTAYSVDEIKNINYQLDQTIGYGYRFYNTDTLKLNVVPGVGVQKIKRSDGDDEFVITSLYQDLEWSITETLSFEQSLAAYVPPSELNNYNYKFEAGVKSNFFEDYIIKLSYKYDYTNVVSANTSKYTSMITTSLGYSF